MIEHGGDQRRVAVPGDRHAAVAVVAEVLAEAHRNPPHDGGGETARCDAPLLARVAVEECLVEGIAQHAATLLLEVGRRATAPVAAGCPLSG